MNGRLLERVVAVAVPLRACLRGAVAIAAVATVLCRSPAARAQAAADAARVCEQVAASAEQDFGLPGGLLNAIGVVESGRWQPLLGRATPWPYAIDVGGEDFNPESAEAAVAKVAALRSQGNESIDVGCFQINLLQHPDAFARLDDAFDPARNAAYAASFLVSLRERTGSWEAAVAAYHSGFAMLGEPYRDRVYAVWKGMPPVDREPSTRDQNDANRLAVARGVVLAPPRLMVRVYMPSDAGAVPMVTGPGSATQAAAAKPLSARQVVAPAVIRLSRARLPVVVTPSGRL